MKLELIQDTTLIWAHRGGRSLAAENTLGALRKGHQAGAHGWEMDVQITKDGEIIVLHDLNLLRTTNAKDVPLFKDNPPALPWRFTLKEIQTLSADIFPRKQCGTNNSHEIHESSEAPVAADLRVPTLTEALRLTAELGIFINVEIKDIAKAAPEHLRKDIVEKVHAIIKAEDMEEQVIISSFNLDYVRESKRLAPHVLVGALTEHTHKGDAVQDAIATGADAWHPGFKTLTRDAVRQARDAGVAVTPYTVNATSQMEQFIEWGVTGIVTDCPQNAPKNLGS